MSKRSDIYMSNNVIHCLYNSVSSEKRTAQTLNLHVRVSARKHTLWHKKYQTEA